MHKRRQRCDSDDDSNDEYERRSEPQSNVAHTITKRYKQDDEVRSRSRHEDGKDDKTLNYEHYKNLLGEVYFTESDALSTDSSDYENFWVFLRKYQQFQQKQEKQKESTTIYDKKNKNNLSFSSRSDKIRKFHTKQEYAGRSRKLTTEELETFESILLLYYDFLQKQKFNKLRKIKKDQMNLPIFKYKRGIIDSINKHQVVVVAGDTGCGKSTQVPQYLMEAGYGKIACTQPRRIACISLAKRVSHETLNEYGSHVAYQVRFDKTKTKATRILFLTEGLLLRQIDNDPTLSKYNVIIMDEVHERHVHTDFLLGVVKCILHQRSDLKLILMSATINLELFSRYFGNAPVAKVPGRLYPIQLHYQPIDKTDRDPKAEKFDTTPYIRVLQHIDKKYLPTERGDVLVFLSGLTEIMSLVEAAREYGRMSSSWIVLPLHSSLSLADQDKVFDYPPEGVRKCIISTNIAETSVTIDGVRFVVDSGKVKEMAHDSGVKMGSLKESWISRASAEQRKGRAGRTGPGVCFRLYKEEEYTAMEEYSTPEIRRVPLESLVLQMVVLGIPDPRLFPFIESPLPEKLEGAIKLLKSQGALTDDECATQIGKTLAKLPVDVVMGKMLITGCMFEAVDPILIIAASLCVQSIFTNKAHRDYDAYKLRKDLESNHGDPLTLHSILENWLEMKSSGEETRRWCKKRGIEEQRLYEVIKLRSQFKQLLTDHGLLDGENDRDDDEDIEDAVKRRKRHADRNQLRKLRLEHKNKDRKKKILKMTDGDGDDDDVDEREKVVGDMEGDIRDLEFRLTNAPEKIQNLLANSRKAAANDTSLLKVIICSALHPQFALSDEHNTFKPDSQQLYHTPLKSFVTLHPTSVLTSDPEQLVLRDVETKDGIKRVNSRHKGRLSYKHQLLAYVTLLETNKPYLINALRVPALQTLLLFSNKIDTTSDLHRLVFDSWLDIEIDQNEEAPSIVMSSIRIRTAWQKLLEHKLKWSESLSSFNPEETEGNKFAATEDKHQKRKQRRKHQRVEHKLMKRLYKNVKSFLEEKIYYRIRRVHLAETKGLYRDVSRYVESLRQAMAETKDVMEMIHPAKGGFKITDYLTYDCLDDDGGFPLPLESSPLPQGNDDDDYYDGSAKGQSQVKYSDKFDREHWTCTVCDGSFFFITAEKLQHSEACENELSLSVIGSSRKEDEEDEEEEKEAERTDCRDAKICEFCHVELKCSVGELIKHMRECTKRDDA